MSEKRIHELGIQFSFLKITDNWWATSRYKNQVKKKTCQQMCNTRIDSKKERANNPLSDRVILIPLIKYR